MRAFLLAIAALALTACAVRDPSQIGAQVAQSQCLDEAAAYPRGVEDCLGIGRAAANIP